MATVLAIGDPAPTFDCRAVLDGEVVELSWRQLHAGSTLVLQFDSLENCADSPDDRAALVRAAAQFRRLHAKLAVVCRDQLFEILTCNGDSAGLDGSEGIPLPMIPDGDDVIASMYDMLAGDGRVAWGHVIIDPAARVRQFALSSSPVGANVDELIRCIEAIRRGRC